MRDLVYELDGLAIAMAANSLARDTVSNAAREIERLTLENERLKTRMRAALNAKKDDECCAILGNALNGF